MKYLHYYEEENEFTNGYWGNGYLEPWVSLTTEGTEHVDYNRRQPLTFTVLQNGTITVDTKSNSGNLYLERDIKYLKDGQMNTISLNSSKKSSSFQVSSGDVVYFFGDNDRYCEYNDTAETDVFVRIVANCKVNVSGNILSMIKSRNWDRLKLDNEYSFAYLFSGSSIVSAEELILPSKIYPWCLSRLFYGCNKLTAAPSLPSKDIEPGCYYGMFCGCSQLTTAPTLPNVEVAKTYCYAEMFNGCVNLEHNIPTSLPSHLEDWCYFKMFMNCKKITDAPEIQATTVSPWCCGYMFDGCTGLTTVQTVLPATTLAEWCYAWMFSGCVSLTNAPELPATTLAESCYFSMFEYCTSLRHAQEQLPAKTLVARCYKQMFLGCANLEKAPDILGETGGSTDYVMEAMFSGCTKVDSLVCLITDYVGYAPTNNWLRGVKEPGTFYKNPSVPTTVITSPDRQLPSTWSVVDYTG